MENEELGITSETVFISYIPIEYIYKKKKQQKRISKFK